MVKKGEYGILRFSSFNLPNCSSHYLIIEEDTLIPEIDVTDELLARLRIPKSRGSRSLQEGSGNQMGQEAEEEEGSTDEVEQNEIKYTVFYQESNQTEINASGQPSKSGIHAVVVTKYCGDNIPPRTLYWRRASKNVSLTFISENLTSSSQVKIKTLDKPKIVTKICQCLSRGIQHLSLGGEIFQDGKFFIRTILCRVSM